MEEHYLIYNLVDENKSAIECKDAIWSIDDTLALIECYSVYKESGSLRPEWNEITSLLSDRGVYKTNTQCSKKWANLLRTYHKIKDKTEKTRKLPLKFQFFNEIDEVYENAQKRNSLIKVPGQAKDLFWTTKETLALIEGYKIFRDYFAKGRSSSWVLISNFLSTRNIEKTSQQCSKKWYNMLRTYRPIKINLIKNGKKFIKFQFFDELDEIFGDTFVEKLSTPIEEVNDTDINIVDEDSLNNSNPDNLFDEDKDKTTLESKSNVVQFANIKRKRIARDKYYKEKRRFLKNEDKRRQQCFEEKQKLRESKEEREKQKLLLLQRLVEYITTSNHPNNLDEETLHILNT